VLQCVESYILSNNRRIVRLFVHYLVDSSLLQRKRGIGNQEKEALYIFVSGKRVNRGSWTLIVVVVGVSSLELSNMRCRIRRNWWNRFRQTWDMSSMRVLSCTEIHFHR